MVKNHQFSVIFSHFQPPEDQHWTAMTQIQIMLKTSCITSLKWIGWFEKTVRNHQFQPYSFFTIRGPKWPKAHHFSRLTQKVCTSSYVWTILGDHFWIMVRNTESRKHILTNAAGLYLATQYDCYCKNIQPIEAELSFENFATIAWNAFNNATALKYKAWIVGHSGLTHWFQRDLNTILQLQLFQSYFTDYYFKIFLW